MPLRRPVRFAVSLLSGLLIAGSCLAGGTPTPYLCPVTSNPTCGCVTPPVPPDPPAPPLMATVDQADICLFVADPDLTCAKAVCVPQGENGYEACCAKTPCLEADGSELCALQLEFSLENHTYFEVLAADESIKANGSMNGAWRLSWLADNGVALSSMSAKHVGTLKVIGQPDPELHITDAKLLVGAGSMAVKNNLTLVSIDHGPIKVPEPVPGALLVAGLLLLGFLARGRSRRANAATLLLVLAAWGAPPAQAQIVELATSLSNADFGLANPSELGGVLAGVGDLNADGVEDLAIGFPGVLGGQGGVLLAFLRHDGTVDQTQFIADGKGGFPAGSLGPNAGFGSALAILTDVDGPGPGAVALAVSAPYEGAAGSIWLLILIPDQQGPYPALILSAVQIPTTEPVHSLASIGDLNADGLPELALGQENSAGTSCPGVDCGAVQILHIGLGGVGNLFEPPIIEPGGSTSGSRFGAAVASVGDLNGDGFSDLAVGSPGFDGEKGAVWILFLVDAGYAISSYLLEDAPGLLSGVSGLLQAGDQFGGSLVAAGDLDENGTEDLVAGLPGRDGVTLGSTEAGSLAFLTLETDGSLTRPGTELSAVGGEIPTAFGQADSGTHTAFGRALARLDVGGDGDGEFFAGAATDVIETSAGIVWRLVLNDPDGDLFADGLGDNCPGVANPDQLDGDTDGVGDACDNCVSVANGPGSGVCLAGDDLGQRGLACSADADCEFAVVGSGFCSADQSDADADGVGDACEQVVVTLDEAAPGDWSLEIDCGAYNVERLSVALFAPDETLPLNLEFGGFGGVPPGTGGCASPGNAFFPFGIPALGCDALGLPGVPPVLANGIGATVDVDSGVFKADSAGNYTFPNGLAYSGLRPNTLYAWLQGTNPGVGPRLCSAGDANVPLANLEIAGPPGPDGIIPAPDDLAISASNFGAFEFGFVTTSEGDLPPLASCIVNKPPAPAPPFAKAGGFRSLKSLPPNLAAWVAPVTEDLSGEDYQDWELCFKSDAYVRRFKVALEAPTGKYGTPPIPFNRADVKWVGCDTERFPCDQSSPPYPLQYPIDVASSSNNDPQNSSKRYVTLVGDLPGHNSRINSTLHTAPFQARRHCVGKIRVEHGTTSPSHAPGFFLHLANDDTFNSMASNQTDDFGGTPGDFSFSTHPLLNVGCTVPEDKDNDGVRTEADNCPNFANVLQGDNGSLDPDFSGAPSLASTYDGIGDKCQCGEGDGDGTISLVDDGMGGGGKDLPNLRDHLLGIDVSAKGFDPQRCDVRNYPKSTKACNILDAILLKRALEGAATLPDPPLCAAANPPPP